MKILISHPTGNLKVRALINAFNQTGLFAGFNTTLALNSSSFWLKFLRGSLRDELLRRSYPIPVSQITTHPLLEFARLAMPKFGTGRYIDVRSGTFSIDAVYRDLDRNLAKCLPGMLHKRPFEAIYAFEGGALETFKMAKHLGLKCIYDLPAAYWETSHKLLLEEAERLPVWASTLRLDLKNTKRKLIQKTQELELADIVIGAGDFGINTLPGWSLNKKIIMAPSCSPGLHCAPNEKPRKLTGNRPLRVLFAGDMSQRNGLADLFEAMKLLNNKNIELVVLGSRLASMKFYREQFPYFTYEDIGSHEQVLKVMSSCDVFCMPSIVEDRDSFMQDAMSCGLPLVGTENSGGAALIQEGYTGFLIPIRSPHSIANRLSWFLENRLAIPLMSSLAREQAINSNWEIYGKTIVDRLTANTVSNIFYKVG